MSRTLQTRRSAPGDLRSLLLMGAVLTLVQVVERVGMMLVRGIPPVRLPVLLTPLVVVWTVELLVFVPGFLLAERAAISRRRAGPYTFVVLVGSALVAAISVPLVDWLGVAPPRSLAPPHLSVFLMVLIKLGLGAFVYAGLRERLEAAQALQELESRRNEMMGRIAASRLEAARARVQPEAFIAELRALRETYVEDPVVGASVLEALITRLRTVSRSATP
jgi:hypothetical protein